MHSFQLPVVRASRDGSVEGLLLFTHLERSDLYNVDITPGFASELIQDFAQDSFGDVLPVIPILNSEEKSHSDVFSARQQSVNWPAFVTGGRMGGTAHPEGVSHYKIILRSLWKVPNFLGCYIENFSLSGEVDRDVLEQMHLCLGRVSVESGVLTVESSGVALVPREVLRP